MTYLPVVAVGMAILLAIAIDKRQQNRRHPAISRVDVDVDLSSTVAECLQPGCGEIAAGGEVLGWALHHTRTTGHPTSAHQPI